MKQLQIGKIYLTPQCEYVVVTGKSLNKEYSIEMVWFRKMESPEMEWNAPYHAASVYWFPLALEHIS